MKKKILALILSLALIVSLLPATFASAADANAAPANENMQIVYGIATGTELSGTALGGTTDLYNDYTKNIYNGIVVGNINSYSMTNGFWKYYGASTTAYASNSKTAYGVCRIYSLLNNWYAFNFYVPAAGTYDITVGAGSGSSSGDACGGRWSYTVIDGGKTSAEISAAVSDVAWDAEKGLVGNALGQLNSDPTDVGYNKTTTDTKSVTFNKAGEYTLVLKVIEKGTGYTSETDVRNQQIYFRGFALKNGDGSKTVPMGFTALDKTSIKAGETATASIAGDLYGSNDWMKKSYDVSEISYVSSDTSVATVSGSTVRAVGEGTAEISAVIDGAALHSVTVSVKGENENVQIVYGITGNSAISGTNMGTGVALYDNVLKNLYGAKTTEANSYATTGGFWKYNSSNSSWRGNCAGFYGQMRLYVDLNQWIAFKFYVPVSGKYDLTVGGGSGAASEYAGGRWAYTVVDGDSTDKEIEDAISNIAWDASTETLSGNALGQLNSDPTDVGNNVTTTHTSKVDLEAGEHILVLKTIERGTGSASNSVNSNIFFKGFALKNGTGTVSAPMGTTTLVASEVREGEITSASATVYGSNDWSVMTPAAGELTFTSSNPTVAGIVGSNVVAKREGTAEITAMVNGVALVSAPIEVLPKNDPAPSNTQIFVGSKDTAAVPNSEITLTVGGGAQTAGTVVSAYQSALVRVSAPETVGNYRFKYWLGTGKIESFETEYSFQNYTNKALLAVYEEIPEETEATVSFYKENSELVSSIVVDKGATFGNIKPATPSLFGYTEFLGWFLGEDKEANDSYVIEKDTEVVALFDGAETITGITVNGAPVGDMEYGEEKTITSDSSAFSYWKRGDKIVSYNKSYTFAAWQNNAAFTAVNDGAVVAEVVAVLDKRGDNYVLEYEIPADCTRLEVGIIFGPATVTVDSCFAKAVSQVSASRGFFTASTDVSDGVAKGYVIFRDANGAVKVAYSK